MPARCAHSMDSFVQAWHNSCLPPAHPHTCSSAHLLACSPDPPLFTRPCGIRMHAGHTRFATSSIPLPSESHPHQWSPTDPVVIWRASGSGSGEAAASASELCGIYITHNGALWW